MADKQDIKENEMTSVSRVSYLRGLNSNNSVLVAPNDVLEGVGFFRLEKVFVPGETYVLPYVSGLIMIQNATSVHQKSIAVVHGDNNGSIIVPQGTINFFSEVENKICIMNTGTNTKYIVKSTYTINQRVVLTFIS